MEFSRLERCIVLEKSDLVFFGLVGIKDFVRKEVPQAIPMQESRNKSLHDKRR